MKVRADSDGGARDLIGT